MPDPFQISAEKKHEDRPTNKVPNTSVTLIYEAKVAEFIRNVTVTWNKSLINYSLTINVENPLNENDYTCRIDLKAWQFWAKKGLKSFQVDERRIDVYWDFRHAKFSNNPEPSSDYYVALVDDDEVVLVIGDLKKDAFKRTKRRPSLDDPILLCKKENIYGKKIFSTKAMLNHGKKEYDIVIEISSGIGEPELLISIDSYEVIHVMNLNWSFRGNENVKMKDNNIELEIYWDVHDWLFSSSTPNSGIGNGLFIFKPGEIDQSTFDTHQENKIGLRYDSPLEFSAPASGFFYVIYAWKIE